MNTKRRFDIDWIRVIVFDLLIFYHVGMLFVPWGFHIKNNEIVDWLVYPMAFVNQWRLPILFVVSGMGTRFALFRRSGAQYISERFVRLFIPLAVGIVLIVPPQVYIERIVNDQFEGSYLDYLPQMFSGIYPSGNFSWHHLWFLPYLLLMSIAATPLFLRWRKEDSTFIQYIQNRVEKRPAYLFIFFIPLFMIDLFLESSFPVTHALIGDWFTLTKFTYLFLVGFVLVSLGRVFWEAVVSIRFIALGLGLLSFPALLWVWQNWDPSIAVPIVRTFNTWVWILVIFGFAAKYLNRESRVIKYRNEAVYPFYILHQTLMMIAAYFLIDMEWNWFLKFVTLAVITFGGSWLIYEFFLRRWRWVRPLFGLRN